MAAPLLLSAFTEIWPFLVPFVSAMLSAGVGFLIATITYRRTEAGKQQQETVAEKKLWRDSRIQAEKTQQADHSALARRFELFEINYRGDMERVASLFSRFVQVSEQHTTMTEQMKWHKGTMDRHDKEFEAVHEELKSLQNDIKNLLRNGNATA